MGKIGKERQAGLDILRCLAMMMVVVLHYLGKGNLLGDVTEPDMGAVGTAAWILETFSIVAVNTYMLLSGYFLSGSSFKLSRLLGLYLQIWMYSVAVGGICAACGLVPEGELGLHYYLSLLFPVSMGHYWFMTAYVYLYLLLPLLGTALRHITKKQFQLVLIVLLAAFSLSKTLLPFRLETDGQGYDTIWYVCVFLVAAYIRKFGVKWLERRVNCALLYLGGCLAIFGEMLVLRAVYLRTGSFGLILKVSYEYNHLFVFLAAVGLFGCFKPIARENAEKSGGNDGAAEGAGTAGKASRGANDGGRSAVRWLGRLAGRVSPYVLGVYLLHENIGLRYVWQRWLGAESVSGVASLVAWTLTASASIFITGVIAEWMRCLCLNWIQFLLEKIGVWRKFNGFIRKTDEIFRREERLNNKITDEILKSD